ncbi:MAG: cysteine biosynthesis protein [Desulfobulbaceae bacterium]|nr:MAG: cysteine biosynthesis protein [Desulfobulbaceae bacterium]
MKSTHKPGGDTADWIPLSTSASFLFSNGILLVWSLMLVVITALLTWGGFFLTTELFDNLTSDFFSSKPVHESFYGWVKYLGWVTSKYLFFFVSRIVAFFLAFLAAFSLSAPLYVFLSMAAEKRYCGDEYEADAALTLKGIMIDLFEGIKIGLLGIFITILALMVSFIPLIGQLAVFFLYCFYCALMFLDYTTSRKRWSLSRKINWLQQHHTKAFKIGVIPALISMIPILNLFLMALVFPLFTVHATLNFSQINRYSGMPSVQNKPISDSIRPDQP